METSLEIRSLIINLKLTMATRNNQIRSKNNKQKELAMNRRSSPERWQTLSVQYSWIGCEIFFTAFLILSFMCLLAVVVVLFQIMIVLLNLFVAFAVFF